MAVTVRAHITGTLWKILAKVGDEVEEEDVLCILESMKMEMPIEADFDGKVVAVHATEGQAIAEGDPILDLEED
jgi:acetyl-CoA carboxylase biotin carboxyl carrier protein